jgi:hypothetical protein
LISAEDIALAQDYVDSHLGVTGEADAIKRLLAERELLVAEHRAAQTILNDWHQGVEAAWRARCAAVEAFQ